MKKMYETFGTQKVKANTEVNDNMIIIEESEESDQFVSLQTIDHAFQQVQHTPALIEQTDTECIRMMNYIDQLLADIEKIRAEKERLKVANESNKSKIEQIQEEIKNLSMTNASIKKKLDKLRHIKRKK